MIGALAGRGRHGLLRRAQPRLDRRRLPPVARGGRRLPAPRRRAPRCGACAVTAAAARRRRASDRHRLGVLDGRRRRAAGGDRRARARARGARDRRRGARDRQRSGQADAARWREAGLEGEVDVIVGTLGKALGSYGAYVCADAEMVRYLINTARSLIFSTAPPPPAIAGALAALELLQERPHRVERLRSNARALRRALAAEGFAVPDGEMHIVPLSSATSARRCASARRRSSAACSPRRSGRRPCRPEPRGCAWRRWPRTRPRSCAWPRRSLGAAARELGLDPAQLGTPLPEPEPHGGGGARYRARRRTRRCPSQASAPTRRRSASNSRACEDRVLAAETGSADASAPFDGEREGAVARAA